MTAGKQPPRGSRPKAPGPQGSRAKDPRRGTGQSGEDAAVAYLEKRGFLIVERNWRCKAGEVDVVARDGETVVFVEVRTKSGGDYGSGIESVTPRKLQRVSRLGEYYLEIHNLKNVPARVDVIGIEPLPDGTFRIEHVRNATG